MGSGAVGTPLTGMDGCCSAVSALRCCCCTALPLPLAPADAGRPCAECGRRQQMPTHVTVLCANRLGEALVSRQARRGALTSAIAGTDVGAEVGRARPQRCTSKSSVHGKVYLYSKITIGRAVQQYASRLRQIFAVMRWHSQPLAIR